ncbi:MAG: hypothetical protein JO104_03090 [Candidatus Eremiobacteraeota bacterium]|nr:hypothetical protein [Candidatus Eremiobacteraeota bacterium]
MRKTIVPVYIALIAALLGGCSGAGSSGGSLLPSASSRIVHHLDSVGEGPTAKSRMHHLDSVGDGPTAKSRIHHLDSVGDGPHQ